MSSSNQHPYETLTPDVVLDAVESTGRLSDARMLALNSYENRVFQVGIEGDAPLIVKFYRPNRWSDAAIREEHDFTQALADQEISVVAPLRNDAGESLFIYQDFRFALYPRQGGHAPNLDDFDTLLSLGRTLGRIHAIGEVTPFTDRPALTVQGFGQESLDFLLAENFLPPNLVAEYAQLAQEVIDTAAEIFARVDFTPIRLHGDCHPGNILWREGRAHFVDFDDARMGPRIQDLWMLLSESHEEQVAQMSEIVEGYQEFCDFNYAELALIEPLRSLRILHYSAWLARRWQDPAFPRYFPWFNTEHYWQQQIFQLREQLLAMRDKPLTLF